jgi:hypothetical protein
MVGKMFYSAYMCMVTVQQNPLLWSNGTSRSYTAEPSAVRAAYLLHHFGVV